MDQCFLFFVFHSLRILKYTIYQSMSDYLHDEYVDLMNIISSLISIINSLAHNYEEENEWNRRRNIIRLNTDDVTLCFVWSDNQQIIHFFKSI